MLTKKQKRSKKLALRLKTYWTIRAFKYERIFSKHRWVLKQMISTRIYP